MNECEKIEGMVKMFEKQCEVRENCKNYLKNKCWYCENYGLYWPENPHILCKRQVKE